MKKLTGIYKIHYFIRIIESLNSRINYDLYNKMNFLSRSSTFESNVNIISFAIDVNLFMCGRFI